jgi:hypothetical protein
MYSAFNAIVNSFQIPKEQKFQKTKTRVLSNNPNSAILIYTEHGLKTIIYLYKNNDHPGKRNTYKTMGINSVKLCELLASMIKSQN